MARMTSPIAIRATGTAITPVIDPWTPSSLANSTTSGGTGFGHEVRSFLPGRPVMRLAAPDDGTLVPRHPKSHAWRPSPGGMAIDPLAMLYSGAFAAVATGMYGWVIAIPWSPFLLSDRLRALFAALPPAGWQASFVFWIPIPAAVWGFLWGGTLSFRADLQPPEATIGAAAMDGLVVATAASVLLWPAVLLYGLPATGTDWFADWTRPRTALLVVAATGWYLLFLVVPGYFLSILAGIGGAMTGT